MFLVNLNNTQWLNKVYSKKSGYPSLTLEADGEGHRENALFAKDIISCSIKPAEPWQQQHLYNLKLKTKNKENQFVSKESIKAKGAKE